MSDKPILVMVVDQSGWSRDSMTFTSRPVQKCGGCDKTAEIWGQIEDHDGNDSLLSAIVVCKECLAQHYMANWPCLDSEGAVVNGGVSYDSILNATKKDWRTDGRA